MNLSLFLHHSQTLCQVVNVQCFCTELTPTPYFPHFHIRNFATDPMWNGFTKCSSQFYGCTAHQSHGSVKSKLSFMIAMFV